MASPNEEDLTLTQLGLACSNLRTLIKTSAELEQNLEQIEKKFDVIDKNLSTASRRVAPLQSLSMATKALEARINRAVSPALALLDFFKLFESLQIKLLNLSSELSEEKIPKKRIKKLIKYVECVDQLNEVITCISRDGEPVIQKLQEVVEFLSRTRATDQFRTHRLKETLVTLKALYETEVDAMRFEGLLDEALLNLQDELESMLQQIRHEKMDGVRGDDNKEELLIQISDLGKEMEVEAVRRISKTLAATDCLDICIDIYVKVRYRRAAKALMRLNPDYLKTYTPEEIDEMEWENQETAISLWIQHFELAVRTVLVSEKKLCNQVLGEVMEGLIWQECFVKIADKIMAVFFRFGEGVARSNKEPQKLFKFLEIFDSLENLKPKFSEVFEGEAGADIRRRFRELEKLLVHASSKVFWEFGLQIEGNSDGFPPPQDGSVPKLVRYAINYLKYLATETYSIPMAKVLQTEQIWKVGVLAQPEIYENLLKDAISNILEALQRNVESKKLRYRDKIISHVFTMNTYWYIYMRSRNNELGKLLGEKYMKKRFKISAEESAYLYQKQAWGPLETLLAKEATSNRQENNKDVIKGKIEAFLKGFNETLHKHKGCYYSVPDPDLRTQIGESIVSLLVPVYSDFLNAYASVLQEKPVMSPDSVQEMIVQVFSGGDRVEWKLRRRDSKDRSIGSASVGSVNEERKIFRRSKSIASDM